MCRGTVQKYTDPPANRRTGSALQPVAGHRLLHVVAVDGVVDALVASRVCRVAVAVERDQGAVGQLVVEPDGPLVRGGRVTGGAHHEDRAAALRGDLLRLVVALDGPVAAGQGAPREERAPGGGAGG